MTGDNRLKRFARAAQTVCIAAWIVAFIATHIPADKLPALPTSDKLLHGVAYFVLTFLLLTTLSLRAMHRLRRMLTVTVVAVFYGALDEITQPLVNRCTAWGDWLADVLGALAAIIVFETIHSLRQRTQPNANDSPDA